MHYRNFALIETKRWLPPIQRNLKR